MPTPTYKPLTEADQPTLYALMHRIYPPVYAPFWPDDGAWYLESQYGSTHFTHELQHSSADYRFVLLDGAPVGIVRLLYATPCPDRPGRPACKLHRLYLDPTIHGRGIGKAAMQWCIDRARRSGAELLWLEAMNTAEEALGFYRSMGFAITAPFVLDMPRMYPARRGMYRLVLDLRPSDLADGVSVEHSPT